MFDLALSDELALLEETVRVLAREHLAPRQREAEAARGPDEATQRAWREIGLAELELPEALGGAGLGPLARAVVNQALGAGDPGAALALDRFGPALYPFLEACDQAPIKQWFLPFHEKPGARAVWVREADAALEVRGGCVRGTVAFVPADRADLLVVLRDDETLLLTEGIEVRPLPGAGLRAAGAAELRLHDAPVVARTGDAASARRALARARLYVAALLVGVLESATAFARAYAQTRVAFGRPIAHHQALAFLLVDMHASVEGARLLLREASWRAEAGLPFETEAASAFADACEAARFVAPNGVQVLGGHGFMQDYPVEKHYREASVMALLLGGVDAARDAAGRALARAGAPVALSAGERA